MMPDSWTFWKWRDAQVLGGQVGEAVRGGLVGDGERVPQVVHGQFLGGLALRRNSTVACSGISSAAAK